jgi:hypothetical protein
MGAGGRERLRTVTGATAFSGMHMDSEIAARHVVHLDDDSQAIVDRFSLDGTDFLAGGVLEDALGHGCGAPGIGHRAASPGDDDQAHGRDGPVGNAHDLKYRAS